MNELEAKCYLTKKGSANNSDHTCMYVRAQMKVLCGKFYVCSFIECFNTIEFSSFVKYNIAILQSFKLLSFQKDIIRI